MKQATLALFLHIDTLENNVLSISIIPLKQTASLFLRFDFILSFHSFSIPLLLLNSYLSVEHKYESVDMDKLAIFKFAVSFRS